jgi:hypothetical protein
MGRLEVHGRTMDQYWPDAINCSARLILRIRGLAFG